MAALICDICGGNLVMDASGEFAVCESCGMKHSKDRVKALVQEIKGVVEVTKGEAEKERLLKNAEIFLKLGETNKAIEIYHQLTNDYPGDYRGWFGLAQKSMDSISSILATEDGLNITDADIINSIWGNRNWSNFLLLFSDLNTLNEKLKHLNDKAYHEVSEFEDYIIKSYKEKNLPFLNHISLAILHGYKISIKCSAKIKAWTTQLVNEYIKNMKMVKLIICYGTLEWNMKLLMCTLK